MSKNHDTMQQTHLGSGQVVTSSLKSLFSRNISGEKRALDVKGNQHVQAPAAFEEAALSRTMKKRRILNTIIPHGIGPQIPLKKASWWSSGGSLSTRLMQGSSSSHETRPRISISRRPPTAQQSTRQQSGVPPTVSSDSLVNRNDASQFPSQCPKNVSTKIATMINANKQIKFSSIPTRDVASLLLLWEASRNREQEAPLATYLKTKQALKNNHSMSLAMSTLSQESMVRQTMKPHDDKPHQHHIVDEDDCSQEGSEGQSRDDCQGNLSFRAYQAENWTEKFEELMEFRASHGHCNVPNFFPENITLAQWVKRQRYQYKLKLENKRSTMSDERAQALEDLGFVWDSHGAIWDERYQELLDYKTMKGHCNVPSRYEANRPLAIWVKRQRRQYKFYTENKTSSMTCDRIHRLEAIGFEWDLRKR